MTSAFTLYGSLEAQPNFPFVDLTEANASITAVMVSNPDIMFGAHVESERLIPTFRYTHPAINRGSEIVFDTTQMRAITYGAAVLEVIAALVASCPDVEKQDLILTTGSFGASGRYTHIMRYAYGAEELFREEMPLTAEVVREAAHAGETNGTYAVLGAALTRKMSVDAETGRGQIIFEL